MNEKVLEPYIWPVLDIIAKKSRRTPKGDQIILFYYVNRPDGSDLSNYGMNVVYLLKQWGAIKIHNKENFDDEIRFYILLDKNFKPIYEEFRKKQLNNKTLEHKEEIGSKSDSAKLYCVIEKDVGYFKFGKYGIKKKIGWANSRPFKFLQATIDPLGRYKSVDAVFTAIWQEKDNKDPRLTNPNTTATRKVEIMKNSAIKELQKGDKLGGKIRFEFNTSKTQVRAVLVES